VPAVKPLFVSKKTSVSPFFDAGMLRFINDKAVTFNSANQTDTSIVLKLAALQIEIFITFIGEVIDGCFLQTFQLRMTDIFRYF
jgi:hypothetical protein